MGTETEIEVPSKEKLEAELSIARDRLYEIRMAKQKLEAEEYQLAYQEEEIEKQLKQLYPLIVPAPRWGVTIPLEEQKRLRERYQEMVAMRPIHIMLGHSQSNFGVNYKPTAGEHEKMLKDMEAERERKRPRYPEGQATGPQPTAAPGVPGVHNPGGVDWKKSDNYFKI